MVNRERVRMLVDALRSGEYRQGTGMLLRSDRHCCLGVACDVADKNGLPLIRQELDNGMVMFALPGTPPYAPTVEVWRAWEGRVLPEAVREWYGLPNDNPDLFFRHTEEEENPFPGRVQWEASELNDQLGLGFDTIADAFEATYLKEEDDGGE